MYLWINNCASVSTIPRLNDLIDEVRDPKRNCAEFPEIQVYCSGERQPQAPHSPWIRWQVLSARTTDDNLVDFRHKLVDQFRDAQCSYAECSGIQVRNFGNRPPQALYAQQIRWRVRSARTSDDELTDCPQKRNEFLRQLKRLERRRESRSASDLIVDFFDDHFDRGDFALCDHVLRDIADIDLSLFSDIVLVAILAVTFPARRKLNSRTSLYKLIHRELVDRYGEEEASLMLDSLQ